MGRRRPGATTLSVREIADFIEGAVSLRRSPTAVQPIRLPAEDLELHHPSLYDPFAAEAAAGIRLRFRTTARIVALDVSHIAPETFPGPPTYDLVLEDGTVLRRSADDGGAAEDHRTVMFGDLPATDKIVEIWLPPGLGVSLHGLTVQPAAPVEPAPHPGARWVTYGSSITHCAWTPPSQTWPAIAARTLGWNLTCLGFNGGCHLDPLVARVMAALPADRFTMKVGINVHNLQTLRERTFAPLVHGFISTLRDSHPTTPITVISPIASPEREESPMTTIPAITWGAEPFVGDLCLRDMRDIVRHVVEVRRRRGDGAIDYLDGRELLGPDDVAHLPDGLHPDDGGYALMAQRFAARFAPGSLEMQHRMQYDATRDMDS
jgi:hypothetical protein